MSRRISALAAGLLILALGFAAPAAGSSKPDLRVTAVSKLPAGAFPGGSFRVTDRLDNHSRKNAGPSRTHYYLSTDRKRSANDIPLQGSRPVGALEGGRRSSGAKLITVPSTASLGSYFVVACADDDHQVSESKEGNNCGASRAARPLLAAPALSPDLPDHPFGSVATGTSSAPATFTITNLGGVSSGPLTIALSGADPNQFGIETNGCAGKTLEPNASCVIVVRFAPTSTGSKSASVTVTGSPGGSAAYATLSGAGITGSIKISPAAGHDFGGAGAGGSSSGQFSFTITNTGTAPTGTLSTSISGSHPSDFPIGTDGCDDLALGPGLSCTVEVGFSPSSTGARSGQLNVSASPGGSASASLSGTGVTDASLHISAAGYNFGSVLDDGASSDAISITVTNSGSLPTGALGASISGSNPSDFQIGTDTCEGQVVQPANTCKVYVTFSPSARGARTATLEVGAAPGGTATANLSGYGLDPAHLDVTPSIWDFGPLRTGLISSQHTFTVHNSGDVASGPLSVSLSTGAEFQIGTNTCNPVQPTDRQVPDFPIPLRPGGNCSVQVRFAPTSVGPKSAILRITATAAGSVSSDLSGTGTT